MKILMSTVDLSQKDLVLINKRDLVFINKLIAFCHHAENRYRDWTKLDYKKIKDLLTHSPE